MNLPSREECRQYFDEFRIPDNILKHCEMVNEVAVFLAKKLNEAGEHVNVDLVDRASLLHDIFKVVELTESFDVALNRPSEEQLSKWRELEIQINADNHEHAAEIYFGQKYPEMARVIAQHRYKAILDPGLDGWEEKIVYYADKLVAHDKVVSLKDRFEEGHKRYGVWPPSKEIQDIDDAVFALEKDIFNKLDITPEEVGELING